MTGMQQRCLIQNRWSLIFLWLLLMVPSKIYAQDHDGCDKCDMLREECEVSIAPKKEEICAFFRKECLQTDTVFVSDKGTVEKPSEATAYQVVAKGKCIDYKEVKEYEKASKKETRSYSIVKKDTVYSFASQNAAFPGGDIELVNFLTKNIKYPATAKTKKIEGTVYLKFVVSKTGSIINIKAMRSPDPELTTEAIRVVKSMPKWEPGRFRKEAVSMVYILPVKFKLH